MEDLTLTILLCWLLGFCIMFYFLTLYFKSCSRLKRIQGAKRVLLITAHPDDETMFFAPAIRNIIRDGAEFHLLCLSNGDYRNRGRIRKPELYSAAESLGIPQENVVVVKHSKLRDDPNVRWQEEIVAEVVEHEIKASEIDCVLTFDRDGVSGHKNHKSLHNAMILLRGKKRLKRSVRIFCLTSVNLFRKYSLVLDFPMSFLLSDVAYVASLADWWAVQKAMAAHYSQYVWFRKLYMIFSR